MKDALRRIAVRLGYRLISSGVGLPDGLSEMIESAQKAISLRELLKRLNINCVLDIGANIGESVSLLRRIGFRGYIFSFEPHPDSFRSLASVFSKDPYWKGINIALGSKNEVRPLNIAERSYHSSLLSSKIIKTSRVADVKVKRLDCIIDSLLETVIEPRVFAKIDTQGFDLEIIKGAELCIDKILGFQSEIVVTPVYENVPHYLESLAYYESLGFVLMDLFTVTRTATYGSILEYDCVMASRKELC
jgi:FkbM family methyltransferase